MSIKSRVQQIASDTVKGYIGAMTTIFQNNSAAGYSGQVQLGVIKSQTDAGQFQVVFQDGSVTLVNPGGTRIVGPGDAVLVGGGAIIG